MALINITDADLKKSATIFRKDLLMMPVIGAQQALQHMTPMPGVAGRVCVGQLSGDIEVGPYDASREDTDGINIAPRYLETYLGSVIKKFDVNQAAKTVYGTLYAQGQELTASSLAQQVLNYFTLKLGQGLGKVLFSASRNDAGTQTKDLFDGFDTITSKEVTAGTIAAANGNYMTIPAITEENALDVLFSVWENASEELREQETKMFVTHDIWVKYNKCYRNEVGSVLYNTKMEQTFLDGTNGRCELVPLSAKSSSSYIHLTTKGNMYYGYGAGLADENVDIEKHHPFLLDYVATMYFGVQFESVSKERLMVAEFVEEEDDPEVENPNPEVDPNPEVEPGE